VIESLFGTVCKLYQTQALKCANDFAFTGACNIEESKNKLMTAMSAFLIRKTPSHLSFILHINER
jgi:hypothetical protein